MELYAVFSSPQTYAVQTPEGRRYTRDGAFAIDPNGILVTKDGHRVLGQGGAELNIGNGPVEIGADGTISSAEGQVGQLARVDLPLSVLVDLASGGALERAGGEAHTIRNMTHMIETNRAFETYMKMIQSLDGLDAQAVSKVGKLS